MSGDWLFIFPPWGTLPGELAPFRTCLTDSCAGGEGCREPATPTSPQDPSPASDIAHGGQEGGRAASPGQGPGQWCGQQDGRE